MTIRRLLAAFAVLLACLVAGAGVALHRRDPLLSLPRPEHGLAADETAAARRDGRSLRHVVLHSAALGDIGFSVSLPDPLPAKRLPLVMVLGGLGTGGDNIRYVTAAGDNAVIGYDWPMPVHFYAGGTTLTQLPALYGRVMAVPAQVASALAWLREQPWADGGRVSLLGFSLGALAAPAIEDVAEHDGQTVGWTVLAYGGAPFGALVAGSPHVKPAWIRPVLASAVNFLLRPLQPTRHLSHLAGQFLILEGEDDSLVPAGARAHLRNAVPEPKTVIVFKGDHMGVGRDKTGLLQEIVASSKAWLVEKGAVDMP